MALHRLRQTLPPSAAGFYAAIDRAGRRLQHNLDFFVFCGSRFTDPFGNPIFVEKTAVEEKAAFLVFLPHYLVQASGSGER